MPDPQRWGPELPGGPVLGAGEAAVAGLRLRAGHLEASVPKEAAPNERRAPWAPPGQWGRARGGGESGEPAAGNPRLPGDPLRKGDAV